ncbi:hypothetical protein [Teichococcus aestuarii]|uniref:Uncharacterized protein n=1 Tax=Teichococcus aestuarii TaxID=568898 RepID=A0A2U1VA43_9PROT|nr:hypothetical protein [Pseudoroseomonas aestuarii]PWC30787.1 hypothetical protein CR165_02495 [Pseudoroseomonas aestuarii]
MEPEPAPLLAFPQTPEDRLRLALRKLETALSAQAHAVAEFRQNLAALRDATGGLATQVHSYQETLGRTAEKVQHAHAAARTLEKTAGKLASMA